MRIVHARPPNFERIVAVFPAAANGPVAFAFGDIIYNPMGVKIAQEIVAHESVHGKRQGSQIEAWWECYLVDPEFRVAEEILAMRAQYDTFCRRTTNRDLRAKVFADIAKSLASPLYGSVISYREACRRLRAA